MHFHKVPTPKELAMKNYIQSPPPPRICLNSLVGLLEDLLALQNLKVVNLKFLHELPSSVASLFHMSFIRYPLETCDAH